MIEYTVGSRLAKVTCFFLEQVTRHQIISSLLILGSQLGHVWVLLFNCTRHLDSAVLISYVYMVAANLTKILRFIIPCTILSSVECVHTMKILDFLGFKYGSRVDMPIKVKATFPLMCHTLMAKGLQSRRSQFIHKFL